MSTFSPRLDALPLVQRTLWPRLQPVRLAGFVLYGGTAIALRLGHRVSVDFDFFSAAPLDVDLLRASLPLLAAPGTTVLQDRPNTLAVLTPDQVKLSFFGRIDFGRIGQPDLTNDGVMLVASAADLLALKLKVIFQRIEAKDYRDIAALLDAGLDLSRGLAAAETLFGSTFAPAEALKALVYFKGGDLDTLTRHERNTLVAAATRTRSLPLVPIVARTLT